MVEQTAQQHDGCSNAGAVQLLLCSYGQTVYKSTSQICPSLERLNVNALY